MLGLVETEAMIVYVDGLRWMAICEWAELRARQLDGLSALIRQYNSAYEQLSEWLDHREEVCS